MVKVTVAAPSSGRAGRRFQAVQELALRDDALFAARTLPGSSSGILVIPEMTGPIGIPDFVAIVGGVRQLEARVNSGVPAITSELDCVLLAALHTNRPRRLQGLADELRLPTEQTRVRLSGLEKVDAVRRLPTGSYVRNPALTPGGSIYALETKIGDWRRAIRQGRSYRTWASGYVLILDQLSPKALEAAHSDVLADGGGLLVASRWVDKPRPRRLAAHRRMLGFEHVTAALSDQSPSA